LETANGSASGRGYEAAAWPFFAPVVHRRGIDGMQGPVHVHGVGVLDGKLIHAGSPPPPQPPTADLGMRLRGVVTVYLGREAILPDPFGDSITFIWESGDDWAVSSDLAALVWWLRKRGVRVRKSALFGSTLIAANRGCFDLSSYERIREVQPWHYIAVEGERYHIRPYPLREYLGAGITVEEAIDEAEAEISGNVRAAAEANFGNVIVHLTGGVDSRLVTAACVRDGLEFVSHCAGPIESNDTATASALCGELGLPMTHRAGWRETVTAPSFRDRLYDEMNAVSGLTLQARTGTAAEGAPDTLILSGGFGERMRWRYSAAGDERWEELKRAIWGSIVFPRDGQIGVFAPEALVVLEALLQEAIESCGGPLEERLDLYRIRYRQYGVGLISRRFTEFVPRFDPLYSLAAARTAVAGGHRTRRSQRAIYELMNRFDPRFSRFPFGEESWPVELGAPEPLPFRGLTPCYIDEPVDRNPLWSGEPVPTAEQLAKVQRSRAAVWQVVHWEETRRLCREAMDRSPHLARIFDRRMIGRLLDREPSNRGHLRLLYSITAMLVWFGDGDAAT
jgi:hypothetical protein